MHTRIIKICHKQASKLIGNNKSNIIIIMIYNSHRHNTIQFHNNVILTIFHKVFPTFAPIECGEYMRIFHKIMLVLHHIVMDMNDVMMELHCLLTNVRRLPTPHATIYFCTYPSFFYHRLFFHFLNRIPLCALS